MRSLVHEVYSREEIIDALHGKLGSRSIDFRFDLLDKFDQKKGDVSHLIVANSSSIDLDNQAEIHRSAKFNMRDDGTVNFLSDRIQPWAVLKMPPVRRTEVVYENKTNINLLRNTGYLSAPAGWATTVVEVKPDNPNSVLAKRNSSTAAWGVETPRETSFVQNQTYTIHFELKTSTMTKLGYNYIISSSGNMSVYLSFANAIIADGEWYKYAASFTFSGTNRVGSILLASDFRAGPCEDFELRRLKLEKGTIATSWAPAPEDIGMVEYQEKWMRKVIRPKVVPSQDIEFPLGVFLLSTPEKSYQNQNVYRSIQAYDKLQILLDDGFTARYVANEGEYVTDVITDVIQGAGITQINIIRSEVQLPTWFSWDPDVSRLEVVNQLLQAINYERLYVDEYGYFTSQSYRSPVIRSAEYDYKTDAWSVISPGATALQDFFAVPNQWVGVISEPDRVPLTYTYENLNPDSPTSIPARGRTKTEYVDVDAADIESLQGIIQKKAFEDSQVYTEMTFQTALMPMHSHNDVYRLQHHKLGIDAKFQELGWSMTLSAGAPMSHTAREIITV